jgi:quercetin dioxygenase-like cupin family protein
MKYDGQHIDQLPEREVFPGFHGRFVHTGDMTLAYWNVDAGSAVPEHHHVHAQVVQLIKGEFQMTIDGEQHVYHAGDVIAIPSDVPHSGRAMTDCVIHDIFIPEREDYK